MSIEGLTLEIISAQGLVFIISMSKGWSEHHPSAKALFISPDGKIFPDTMICSGLIPDQLGGQPCPFSNEGRLPDLIPLHADDQIYTADKGAPGDLCPPCAKQQLGPLAYWEWHRGQRFPTELLPLRLFKCRQWFWLVIPGLRDDAPTRLTPLS